MYSEIECGVCYLTYNAGRRCPRKLRCQHSFCESCLLALSRHQGPGEARPEADRLILCPLCRQTTAIPGDGRVRAELRLDEGVLERLLAEGVLDREEEEEEDEDPEAGDGHVQDAGDDSTPHALPAEESHSFSATRGGRLRQSWKKVWRKISGKSSRQSGREMFMTNDDLKNFAMMSSFMF